MTLCFPLSFTFFLFYFFFFFFFFFCAKLGARADVADNAGRTLAIMQEHLSFGAPLLSDLLLNDPVRMMRKVREYGTGVLFNGVPSFHQSSLLSLSPLPIPSFCLSISFFLFLFVLLIYALLCLRR
jgi:hypothetical protein